MQLCALETHIRISRNLKKFVDLMRNHRSGPETSLQAQASGPKSQEVSLWVAMALCDSYKTCSFACENTGGNTQPIV